MNISDFRLNVFIEVVYESDDSITIAFSVGDGPVCIMTVDQPSPEGIYKLLDM